MPKNECGPFDGTPAGYNTWRANFGQTTGIGSVAGANTTVPEPTTVVMLIATTVGMRLRASQYCKRVPKT